MHLYLIVWRHALSYDCHLKKNQTIKLNKLNGLNWTN